MENPENAGRCKKADSPFETNKKSVLGSILVFDSFWAFNGTMNEPWNLRNEHRPYWRESLGHPSKSKPSRNSSSSGSAWSRSEDPPKSKNWLQNQGVASTCNIFGHQEKPHFISSEPKDSHVFFQFDARFIIKNLVKNQSNSNKQKRHCQISCMSCSCAPSFRRGGLCVSSRPPAVAEADGCRLLG